MNLKTLHSMLAILVAACAVPLLGGCGGAGGGDSATTTKSAILIGKMAAQTAAKSGGGLVALAAGDPVDVHLLSDPNVKTTVGEDGSFTLRGLPEGNFTLVFTQSGTEVGTLDFREVAANQQITITIQLADGEVVLIDEDRRGIGHAGVELEGPVQNVIVLDAAADSRFVIANREVVARPGVTAIREGTTRRTVADVTVGRQVHVKGTTVADSTDILAYEIKLQNPATTTPAGGTAKITICHIPPGSPGKARTISVSASAWFAHQAHGDTEGACPPPAP